MFLLEKLPRESAQAADEGPGAGVMLSRSIAAQLGLCLHSPWTPPFCKVDGTAWSGTNFWTEVCDVPSCVLMHVHSHLHMSLRGGWVQGSQCLPERVPHLPEQCTCSLK